MSILDDIQQQADNKRQQQDNEKKFAAQLEQTYIQHINPRLNQVFSYFNELINNLNYIDEPVVCSYEIPGAGQVNNFEHTNYRISADSSDRLTEITINFLCLRNKPIDFLIESETDANKVRDDLSRLNVGFKHRPEYVRGGKHAATLFTLTGQIPVQLRLFLEPSSINIVLEAINLPRLGIYSEVYKPHELTDEFMDNLARFMLRKDSPITMTASASDNDSSEMSQEEQTAKLKKQLRAKSHDPAFAQENKTPKPGFFKRLFSKNH